MKALVTGATGFVGGHLVRALVARGDAIVALARRPEAHAALTALGATPVGGSLENDRALTTALADVDVVYHLAGVVAAKTEADYLAVNEGGTQRLIDAVRKQAPGARFVHVSSQAALGPSPRGTPLAEDAPCRPITPYGRSKLAGELALRGSGLAWTIVRPSPVYGPGDRAFLSLFEVVRTGFAPVFGSGNQELSLVYVEDLARAIVLAGSQPGVVGEVLHTAHTEVILSRDVARAAGAALGRSPIVVPVPGVLARPVVGLIELAASAVGRVSVINSAKMDEFLAPSWLLDSRKAERLLGWKAELAATEGMRRTGAWYKEKGWL